MAKQLFDESTRKALFFVIGALIAGYSVNGYETYGVISIIGILVGIFFVIKSLE